MPTMSEATSSLNISKDLLTYASPREQILKWIQDHPEDCKKTTISKISNTILLPNSGLSHKQILSLLYDMSRQKMLLIKNYGIGNTAKKTIYINYIHRNIPQSIIDTAPDKLKQEAREIVEGIAIKNEAREILLKEQKESNKILEASQLNPTKKEVSENDSHQSTSTNIDIPLGKDGQFSLTLNLNFYFNR